VGNELLLGATIDTNGAWLGIQLADLGIPVRERRVVADHAGEIAHAVQECLKNAELVVVCGGLGPTPDDLTRQAVADAFGLALHTDPELMRGLEARFKRYGHTRLPEHNVSQAQVPQGATVLANPRGSAPGLLVPAPSGGWVVLLPGVPREMRGITLEEVLPRVATLFEDRLQPILQRWIRTTGIAESVLSERVSERLPGSIDPVELAFLPRLTGVDIRLTIAQGEGASSGAHLLEEVEALLAPVVDPFRYYADETGDVVEAVSRRLARAGQTVAVAESCTGGLLAQRLTGLPGSSQIFLGGLITYSDPSKIELLGVDAALIASHGAVSEAVALAMARGARSRLETDWALSITGVAGPGGGSEAKPVGTVWTAVVGPDTEHAQHRRFPGDREGVRVRSAQAALALLHSRLAE